MKENKKKNVSLIKKFSKEELEKMIKDCNSLKDLYFMIGYTHVGGNSWNKFKKVLSELKIDYSFFIDKARGNIITEKQFAKKINRYTSKDLPNTRNYIINKLKEDFNWKESKGIIHKLDFIEEYYNSRKKSGKPIYNYDFSLLPEIIKTRTEIVTIIVNEVDYYGKLIDNWKVNFITLVTLGNDHKKLSKKEQILREAKEYEETFKKNIKTENPNYLDSDLSKINYINSHTKVELVCQCCGKIYFSKPNSVVTNKFKIYCPECSYAKAGELNRKYNLEKFKEVLNNKFPNVYEFPDNSIYLGYTKSITVKCVKCGTIYRASPRTLLNGVGKGCLNCRSKLNPPQQPLTIDEIIERIETRLGKGIFDFSLAKEDYIDTNSLIRLIDISTGIIYEVTPHSMIYTNFDPRYRCMSRGELYIKNWLDNRNIKYFQQEYIAPTNKVFGRGCDSRMFVDFKILLDDGRIIYLEYNGFQHYLYGQRFTKFKKDVDPVNYFLRQVMRDINLKNYCLENDIIFLEIPATEFENLDSILTKSLLEKNINFKDYITLPEYKFPEGYSMEDVYKLIEEEGGISYER